MTNLELLAAPYPLIEQNWDLITAAPGRAAVILTRFSGTDSICIKIRTEDLATLWARSARADLGVPAHFARLAEISTALFVDVTALNSLDRVATVYAFANDFDPMRLQAQWPARVQTQRPAAITLYQDQPEAYRLYVTESATELIAQRHNHSEGYAELREQRVPADSLPLAEFGLDQLGLDLTAVKALASVPSEEIYLTVWNPLP